MRTENKIKAEFNAAWQQGEWQNLHTNPDDGFKIWQACQVLNDKTIAAKDAEIARLRLRINNALHMLNVNRNDIKQLSDNDKPPHSMKTLRYVDNELAKALEKNDDK